MGCQPLSNPEGISTRFAREARELSSREYRRSGCPCGNRRSPCRNRIAGPRALYHRPCRRQSAKDGLHHRVLRLVPPSLGPVLVAKNLHLKDFLLIFHRDSAGLASAVPNVEISDNASILNDDATDSAARHAGRQPALTGCPWH